MQLVGSLFINSSLSAEEIEPIDYKKIVKNPPKWVEDTRRDSDVPIPEIRDVITATEKTALFAISAMIIASGAALFIFGLLMPIPTAGVVIICGLGLIFTLVGAISFESTYKKETIENV